MKVTKNIPKFKSETEEKVFWENNDTSEYIDWKEAESIKFPNLQKTSRSISLSLPIDLIEKVKIQAHKINVPYHSLMKLYISKQLAHESKVSL